MSYVVLILHPFYLKCNVIISSGLDLLSEHLATDGNENSFLCSFFNPFVNNFESLLSKYGPTGVLKKYDMSFAKMVNEVQRQRHTN